MEVSSFEKDPYPGEPKILFIGLGSSSHAHSWVNLLLHSRFNVRMFCVPDGGAPPNDWKVPAYLCDPSRQLPYGLAPELRQSLYPYPEEIELISKEIQKRNSSLRKNPVYWSFLVARKIVNSAGYYLKMPVLDFDYSAYADLKSSIEKFASPELWLAEVIRSWRPDIIHTFGMFDGQGGAFYLNVRDKYELSDTGKWVLQLRGGSDIALRRYNHEASLQIFRVLAACDEIITDNLINIEYIKELGFGSKVSSISPVPGTGGLEIGNSDSLLPPSERQRIILWPKAYESKWSKALPVMEGIKYAWNAIKPCKIVITAVTPEVREWLYTLPRDILSSCEIQERIPRNEMMRLMRNARVLLAPSLVDGVPNVLYEAMVSGAFPIISPLDTITPVVSEPQNVFFARNLYPQEIADALDKAMNDDQTVDFAVENNFRLVKKIASHEEISCLVGNYYITLQRKTA